MASASYHIAYHRNIFLCLPRLAGRPHTWRPLQGSTPSQVPHHSSSGLFTARFKYLTFKFKRQVTSKNKCETIFQQLDPRCATSKTLRVSVRTLGGKPVDLCQEVCSRREFSQALVATVDHVGSGRRIEATLSHQCSSARSSHYMIHFFHSTPY